ncbi:MAG: DUF1549 and DUF1553 domain-containing protein [Pirellulaceae bacterium]|nr:DUF1549 and DUF1553 domain-containing protein [Pirellulaceae bacterium]
MRWGVALLLIGLFAPRVVAADRPLNPVFESDENVSRRGKIDAAVFAKLRQEGIEPARLCSDAVFLRRVYLDVIGTLPTLEEARQFLADPNPHKRRDLIDQLLERDEFAEYWALKWCDLLRVKAEFPINLWPNAVQAYHRWIKTALRENMRYDEFARALLCASGSNFRDGPVNFYRASQSKQPEALARAVALTFMGTRAETWPPEKLAEMAVFFQYIGYKKTREWKEEIVYFDSQKLLSEGPKYAVLPDGSNVELTADRDPREVFADWLISPKNPDFARCIVNRVWFWLLGRGIIHEPDDIRPDNPPANVKLLELLERELYAAKYDLKALFRLILNSRTYQLSSIPQSDHSDAAQHFAYYPLRRLDAEVLVDALCQISGTTEEYSSPIPEPFTFIPPHQRSIALADGSITSTFLEMFGRPPRDTGLELERNNRPSAAQRLHLLNSSHVQRKIEQSAKLRELTRTSKNMPEAATRLYLTILARFPTERELQVFDKYAKSDVVQGHQALTDLTWALLNSVEFLYRH